MEATRSGGAMKCCDERVRRDMTCVWLVSGGVKRIHDSGVQS